jgi:hypothetical protein
MLRNFLELASAWNTRRGRAATKARKPSVLQAT